MIAFFFFFNFFFFENIHSRSIVQAAFRLICGNKLIHDGYCDMEKYIFARIDKNEMLADLLENNSPYAELYKKTIPNSRKHYGTLEGIRG